MAHSNYHRQTEMREAQKEQAAINSAACRNCDPGRNLTLVNGFIACIDCQGYDIIPHLNEDSDEAWEALAPYLKEVASA
jgi:hypothetical protein